jgi:hypothetical protein
LSPTDDGKPLIISQQLVDIPDRIRMIVSGDYPSYWRVSFDYLAIANVNESMTRP